MAIDFRGDTLKNTLYSKKVMSTHHPYLTLKINVMKDAKRFSPSFKNVVLNFLFTFNIFESEFFKEPKWDDSQSNTRPEFKSVRERKNEIQEICNENNYPLYLLENFQSHFASVYIENNAWTDRFKSLCKSDFNKNGYEDWEMKNMYSFLNGPLERNKKYAIKNALTLSYTFRNNLFHGQKDIRDLEVYEDDFEEITDFIVSLMKYLDEINADEF